MRRVSLYVLVTIAFILSGCLYPQSELAKNQVPNETQMEVVQTAVNQYREKMGGLVPIKTKPSDTPVFEKYIIDFQVLKEENLLAELPGNAYENGGYYQYALIDPEDNPTVKLIDLRMTQILQDIYVKLHFYQEKHTYLPLAENIGGNYFTIDFEKLGYSSDQYVISPYSHEELPVIIDNSGKLYVDYRADIHSKLLEADVSSYENMDTRYILVENSPFLPVYSPKYVIEDGNPKLDTIE